MVAVLLVLAQSPQLVRDFDETLACLTPDNLMQLMVSLLTDQVSFKKKNELCKTHVNYVCGENMC